MNQSNKALRDSLAVDRYGSRYIDLTETQQLTVNRYIALVTNHIKGKMPEKKVEPKSGPLNSDGWYNFGSAVGYNKALDEVSQILNELGEVK